MDWAADFYRFQDRLAGVASGPVLPHHRQDAARVRALTRPGAHILELGAGGGQRAAALAELGLGVTAIEFQPAAARHARTLAAEHPQLRVLEADFYTVELPEPVDAVCYWDGFGLGTDADQRRLLRRVQGWLRPGGFALMDIYTPWYWAAVSGVQHRGDGWAREYGFDARGCRMLDSWWATGRPEHRLTQSLRCYSPADLELLLEGTGLHLDTLTPGGHYDQERRGYAEHAPLGQCMTYSVTLRPG